MANAFKKASASDVERNIAASVKKAIRLKVEIQGLQDELRATEDRIHSLEANIKDVQEAAAKVHAAIRRPLSRTSAKPPCVRREGHNTR